MTYLRRLFLVLFALAAVSFYRATDYGVALAQTTQPADSDDQGEDEADDDANEVDDADDDANEVDDADDDSGNPPTQPSGGNAANGGNTGNSDTGTGSSETSGDHGDL